MKTTITAITITLKIRGPEGAAIAYVNDALDAGYFQDAIRENADDDGVRLVVIESIARATGASSVAHDDDAGEDGVLSSAVRSALDGDE